MVQVLHLPMSGLHAKRINLHLQISSCFASMPAYWHLDSRQVRLAFSVQKIPSSSGNVDL